MITGPTAEGKLSNRKETLSENIKLYDRVCTHVSSVSSNNFHLEVRPLDNTQEHTTINSFSKCDFKGENTFFPHFSFCQSFHLKHNYELPVFFLSVFSLYLFSYFIFPNLLRFILSWNPISLIFLNLWGNYNFLGRYLRISNASLICSLCFHFCPL